MELGVGALMHDVGKIALPDRVRLAREDFNAGEAALYRDHVAQGLILGRRMGLSADAQLVIAQHHELADGSGFPSALMLPRMSLPARIVALVNRYDNLCNAALAGAVDHAARGPVAPVRAMPLEVRRDAAVGASSR